MGSTTGAGGFTYTWPVDSGIVSVDLNNRYHGWIYARASNQSHATSYTILKWAFVEFTLLGGYYDYYGGMVPTH
jgi:hypothetical protein